MTRYYRNPQSPELLPAPLQHSHQEAGRRPANVTVPPPIYRRLPMHGHIDERPWTPTETGIVEQSQAQADPENHHVLATQASQQLDQLPSLPTGQSAMLGLDDHFSVSTGRKVLCLRNVDGEVYCKHEVGYWRMLSEVVSRMDQKRDQSLITADPVTLSTSKLPYDIRYEQHHRYERRWTRASSKTTNSASVGRIYHISDI